MDRPRPGAARRCRWRPQPPAPAAPVPPGRQCRRLRPGAAAWAAGAMGGRAGRWRRGRRRAWERGRSCRTGSTKLGEARDERFEAEATKAGTSHRQRGSSFGRETVEDLAQGARPASRRAPRAVRRDGLLEPVRRHRQGRQGPRHVQGARRPSPSTGSPPGASPGPTRSSARRRPTWPSARTSSSTSRSPPRSPRATSPGSRPGPSRRASQGTVDAEADDLRRGTRAGLPQDARRQGRRRRGGPLRAVRGPRRRHRPPDAHGERRRARRTSWWSRCRSAPGACRRSPRPRAPAATTRRSSSACPPGRTYESPEMLIVVSPTLERMLIELALGARRPIRWLDERVRRSSCRSRRHDGRPRRRPARGDLGPGLPAGHAAPRGTPEAAAADRPDPGAGRRADRAQNEDGGWPWVGAGRAAAGQNRRPPPSDRLTSARGASGRWPRPSRWAC